MQILLYFSYALFVTIEIVLSRAFRSAETDKKDADKKSLKILWGTILTSILLAVFISKSFDYPIFSGPFLFYFGLIVLYLGMIIRIVAVLSLGKFFTVDVTIRDNHKLKKDGLFKYVRHPNYSALILSFLGMAITFNNWISLLVMVVPITIAFIVRINIEEKVLEQHFGSEYVTYCNETKRLIPFIY